jgi:ABC-type multidrug transport system ATPase subunit
MVIETKDLTFKFDTTTVANSLSLQVPEGSIYGFLGPNGAGKTTTIKLLLSLLELQQGSIEIFGLNLKQHRTTILSKIGSLIEQPAIYAHLTGRENLINRAIQLRLPQARVAIMLDLVKLTPAADKKAGNYSLGMKQRLGIALAMISDPELLILDEPTNGLDPNGIIEMRELLINLVTNHGKTVFLSSHLLAEVERMATHVGIINYGELRFQGEIKDLRDISRPKIIIETNDTADAANLLKKNGHEILEVENDYLSINYQSKKGTAQVNLLLNQNDHEVYSIYKDQKDLEQLFLEITQNPRKP